MDSNKVCGNIFPGDETHSDPDVKAACPTGTPFALLLIAVGDIVKASAQGYTVVGEIIAFTAQRACIVAADRGSWEAVDRRHIVQIIKRTTLPQPPRLFRVTAEVTYLVKANSAEEAAELVANFPDRHIDFVLVEPEDAVPFP